MATHLQGLDDFQLIRFCVDLSSFAPNTTDLKMNKNTSFDVDQLNYLPSERPPPEEVAHFWKHFLFWPFHPELRKGPE